MPVSRCTACGALFDAATEVEFGTTPSPGDVTVCIRCAHVMVYADDMTLRNPTIPEMIDVAGDKRLLLAIKAAHHIIVSKTKKGTPN